MGVNTVLQTDRLIEQTQRARLGNHNQASQGLECLEHFAKLLSHHSAHSVATQLLLRKRMRRRPGGAFASLVVL